MMLADPFIKHDCLHGVKCNAGEKNVTKNRNQGRLANEEFHLIHFSFLILKRHCQAEVENITLFS